MRKVVQYREHGGQCGAAKGTEERAGSLSAGAGGEERRLLQHDLAHRGRPAGSSPPNDKEACRSPGGCPFGADSWRRRQGWLRSAAIMKARSTDARTARGRLSTLSGPLKGASAVRSQARLERKSRASSRRLWRTEM